MLAGYNLWFPKAFGYRLSEFWGRISAWCFGIGFMLAFFPLYLTGLSGMPRRSQEILQPGLAPYLLVAEVGALILFAGLAALIAQLVVSIRQRDGNRVAIGDPWDGRNLEWASPAPPPAYNFHVLPRIEDRNPFHWLKENGLAYQPFQKYEDIVMPDNSAVPLLIGAASFIAVFGLVWHIWWASLLGIIGCIAAVIGRSFMTKTHHTILAADVRRDHLRWLDAVARATAVARDEEIGPTNRGLAKQSA